MSKNKFPPFQRKGKSETFCSKKRIAFISLFFILMKGTTNKINQFERDDTIEKKHFIPGA